MNEREKKYLRLLDEQKTQGFKREEQLRHELELLKKSFHVYKVRRIILISSFFMKILGHS
jgi:hypothetical protein